MIIEKLQPQHVAQAAALLQQLVPFDIDPAAAEAEYEALTARGNGCVLVAREGDEIIGTVSGFCCRGLAGAFLVVEDLIVREGIRGGGIGRQLMMAIDEFGRSHGCKYAMLVSSGFRTGAHRFYESLGYDHDVRGFRKFL